MKIAHIEQIPIAMPLAKRYRQPRRPHADVRHGSASSR